MVGKCFDELSLSAESPHGVNRAGFRILDAWATADTVIDLSRLINSSTEAAWPSVARNLYFKGSIHAAEPS
jgi:hypothetical protein